MLVPGQCVDNQGVFFPISLTAAWIGTFFWLQLVRSCSGCAAGPRFVFGDFHIDVAAGRDLRDRFNPILIGSARVLCFEAEHECFR